MIVLANSGVTNFVCTLFENAALSANTSYTMEVSNEESFQKTLINLKDESLYPSIYNEFNYTASTLSVGAYTYKIFENPLLLSSTTGLNLVECGKLKISATTNSTSYTYTGKTTTNTVYYK